MDEQVIKEEGKQSKYNLTNYMIQDTSYNNTHIRNSLFGFSFEVDWVQPRFDREYLFGSCLSLMFFHS